MRIRIMGGMTGGVEESVNSFCLKFTLRRELGVVELYRNEQILDRRGKEKEWN